MLQVTDISMSSRRKYASLNEYVCNTVCTVMSKWPGDWRFAWWTMKLSDQLFGKELLSYNGEFNNWFSKFLIIYECGLMNL